jgi:glycosyltransferase involved in cell wall biosynthesis
LLHAHQRREAVVCLVVGMLSGVPVVEHAHTLLPNRLWRRISFRSCAVFAVSPEVARMVEEDFASSARVVTVGNTPALTSRLAPWLAQLNTGEPLRVLGVGRLEDQKDPFRFIDIIAEMSKVSNVRGEWLGEGPLLESAKDYAERSGAPVMFRGFSPDVVGALDACHGLLMTSKWEGLPLVILEAMSRKRPVVASDIGGVRTLLADGKGVLLTRSESLPGSAGEVLKALTPSEETRVRVERAFNFVTDDLSADRVFGSVEWEYFYVTGAR